MPTIKEVLKQDWRTFCRAFSFYLGLLGSAITGILVAFPDAALYAWNMLPADLKSTIPERYTPLIGMSIFVVSLAGRMVKRKDNSNVRTDLDQ